MDNTPISPLDQYVMSSKFAREQGIHQRAFTLMLRERPDLAPQVIRRHTRIYARRGDWLEFLRKLSEPYSAAATATATATAKK